MPGAASCTPAAVAQPPARFRSSQDAGERKAARPDAPIPTGLPCPRELCKSPRTPSGSVKAHSDVDVGPPVQQRGGDPANSTTRTVMPAGQPSQQARAPSIMELVNQAVRRDEQQEALVRAGVCPSPRAGSSSRGASPRGAPFFAPFGSARDYDSSRADAQRSSTPRSSPSSAAVGRPPVAKSPRGPPSSSNNSNTLTATAAGGVAQRQAAAVGSSKPPLSPMATHPGSAQRLSGASMLAQHAAGASTSTSITKLAAAPAGHQQQQVSPRAAPAAAACSPRAASAAGEQHSDSAFATADAAAAVVAAQTPCKPAAAASLHPMQQQHPHAAAAGLGCDGASDDGTLTPESSLCSSASSSSLCSYGSLASSVISTCSSTGSRPKSILVRRSHSSSSGASSPCASKHVRWRDGESVRAEPGTDLVAVLVLNDTPEIRRLRKDTWPERSKGRDVSVSIPSVTVPLPRIGGSGSPSSSSRGVGSSCASTGGAQAAAAAAAGGNSTSSSGSGSEDNPLVATVKDWKEKLRALSAERRAQRLSEMQDTWAARQAARQRQILQRQQREAAAAAAAAAAATAAAAAAVAELAVAEKQSAAAGGGAGVAVSAVINLQAVAGPAVAPQQPQQQACC